jgi:two-component system, NarL family, nitrate/nitrite response regulator NarL
MVAALRESGLEVVLDTTDNRIQSHADIDVVLISADGLLPALIATIHKCKIRFQGARILLFGGDHSDEEIVALIENGVRAYTSMSTSLEELVTTVRALQCGESLCSGRLGALVSTRIASLAKAQREDVNPGRLTAREQETLRLIAAGLSNKEIAEHLSISSHTVKVHVHRILEKLRVHRRRDAARWAFARASSA